MISLKKIEKYALYLAFAQAWIATVGSLYFSEIKGLVPCQLCWYQRILMYPLTAILAIAIIRKERNIAYYVLPLALIGATIAFYQYLLQMTPLSTVRITQCSVAESCNKIDTIYFGFITIPFLSMVGFLVIAFLMFVLLQSKKAK